MTTTQRRIPGVLRGLLIATVSLVLVFVVSLSGAAAQEDYPDGGNDEPPTVQGQSFEPAPPAAAPAEGGSSFAATGAYIALMVAGALVLVAAGIWLQRRGEALDSSDS